MSYKTLDQYPDLTALQMYSATKLYLTPDSTGARDKSVYVIGGEKYASQHSIYEFTITVGSTYGIISTSYFDPDLRIYDEFGNTIAVNEEGDDPSDELSPDGGYYGTDSIFETAPYSGTFYVDAGWIQGSYNTYYGLLIGETLDTVPVTPDTPVTPEQIQPAPADLNGWEYLACNNDLMAAFGTDTEVAARHYVDYGFNEGRPTDFDEWGYLAANNDLMAAFGTDADAATRHYVMYGHNEGRPNDFNAWGYLASNADLMTAFGANTEAATRHFVECGRLEGRSTYFDAISYLASNQDLAAAFGTDVNAATRHYVENGRQEGRIITVAALSSAAMLSPDIQPADSVELIGVSDMITDTVVV